MNRDLNRREVVKKIAIVVGGVVTVMALPARWTKPVVESIVAPAHAALSGPTAAPTTTTTTTTTPAPSTTSAD